MNRRCKYLLPALLILLLGCRLSSALTPSPVATIPPTATPIVIIATPTPLGEDALAPIDIEEQLITNLYERVGPSVVHITARVVTMDFFFGPRASEGTGSGFVLDKSGHIVTNYHVIEGAESLEVRFSDETQVPAQVIGVDPPNDLAVIKVDLAPGDLSPVELGESAGMRVGQRAIAIGNPFGLDRTLTTGVISALGRPLQTDADNFIYEVIQTDAAINPGNSGGPLLNSRGLVIGVNTAIREGAEGIGFAVPVDTVRRIVPALIERGFFPHPWLGFLGYSITPELAQALDLSVDGGILVAQLYRDGPAISADIRGATRQAIVGNRRMYLGGDVITAVNGQPLTDWQDLQEFLALNTEVGESITLQILRDGDSLDIEIVIAAQP